MVNQIKIIFAVLISAIFFIIMVAESSNDVSANEMTDVNAAKNISDHNLKIKSEINSDSNAHIIVSNRLIRSREITPPEITIRNRSNYDNRSSYSNSSNYGNNSNWGNSSNWGNNSNSGGIRDFLCRIFHLCNDMRVYEDIK